MIGWRLDLDVEFPEGLAPGASRERTRLVIARNGQGELVLRGTSLAGVVKNEVRKDLQTGGIESDEVKEWLATWFGFTRKGKSEAEGRSRLLFDDATAAIERGPHGPAPERAFHARNRHTGSVLENSLFSAETWPPRTRTTLRIWIDPFCEPPQDGENEERDQKELLGRLLSAFELGIWAGGNRARGLGRVVLRRARLARYDIREFISGLGLWYDDRLAVTSGQTPSPGVPPQELGVVALSSKRARTTLDVKLGIPRGQDFVVADGRGDDADVEPQVVEDAQGNLLFRLPGSTLRGAFRSWTHHAAAREALADETPPLQAVADSRTHYNPLQPPKGNDLGWCFDPPEESPRAARKVPGGIGRHCPVADLFGSLHREGRIQITDGYAKDGSFHLQRRAHVAIDPITGSAAERLYFDNDVLCDPEVSRPEGRSLFPVHMEIRDSKPRDIRWLAVCLSALHRGLIRIGSSRAAGRLEVATAIVVRGHLADEATAALTAAGVPCSIAGLNADGASQLPSSPASEGESAHSSKGGNQ